MTSVGAAWVEHRGYRRPAELVAPLAVREVFTAAEIRHCGGAVKLTRWAGRLAAKRAVVATVGDPSWSLLDIEILPERRACHDPAKCSRGHPPAVRLRGGLTDALPADVGFTLSISHTDRSAVAIVVLSRRPPTIDADDGGLRS